MSVYLLDINVLVALLWTNHEQHQAASLGARIRNVKRVDKKQWFALLIRLGAEIAASRVVPNVPTRATGDADTMSRMA
jgi:hypothetical protein